MKLFQMLMMNGKYYLLIINNKYNKLIFHNKYNYFRCIEYTKSTLADTRMFWFGDRWHKTCTQLHSEYDYNPVRVTHTHTHTHIQMNRFGATIQRHYVRITVLVHVCCV
jgi:hypothetical protein